MSEWKAFAAYAIEYLGMPEEAMPLLGEEAKWSRKAVRINAFVLEVGNFGHKQRRDFSGMSYLKRKFELRSKWENEIDDSRRKEAAHIIAEKTKKGETLDQEDKDEILNNLLRKIYPEKEWRERLFKEKKVLFVKDIIQRLMAVIEHSPLTAWNYREFQFFKEHWQDVVNEKQLILTANEFLGSGLQMFYKQLVFEQRIGLRTILRRI